MEKEGGVGKGQRAREQGRRIGQTSMPTHPSRLRSTRPGATLRTYVHVHTRRRKTRMRDWKLNSADWD